MVKDDEKQFLIKCFINPVRPREIINSGTINHKRAWYLLDKWATKDIYDYGVTLDLGWLTEKGKDLARKMIEGE